MREGEEWLRGERIRTGILGSLIPGSGDLYAGRLMRGILLCVPAVWLLAEGFLLDILTPSLRFASLVPTPIRYTGMFLLLLMLFLCSIQRSWRQSFTDGR